jgi:hypothetical protein
MRESVTYEEVATLAEQLPPWEQLKLVASMSGRLSQTLANASGTREKQLEEYSAQVQSFLQMSEENAAECVGEVDASADIRQIREERTSRL